MIIRAKKNREPFDFELNMNYLSLEKIPIVPINRLPSFAVKLTVFGDTISLFELRQISENTIIRYDNFGRLPYISTNLATNLLEISNSWAKKTESEAVTTIGIYYYYVKFASGFEFKSEVFVISDIEGVNLNIEIPDGTYIMAGTDIYFDMGDNKILGF